MVNLSICFIAEVCGSFFRSREEVVLRKSWPRKASQGGEADSDHGRGNDLYKSELKNMKKRRRSTCST